MSFTILVYGWYDQGNIGDDLFIDAFKLLFPSYKFIFTNCITTDNLKDIDAIFIGGGSLLESPINIDSSAFIELQSHSIFYIGVGAETNIHAMHESLMKIAKLIAIRSEKYLEKISAINNNTIVIPDLVYCLPINVSGTKIEKSILILPNMSTVPSWTDPHWKHAAWGSFKVEFVQFIEEIMKMGFDVKFLPMCSNDEIDDSHAAIEIINAMSVRNKHLLLDHPKKESIVKIMSQYSVIITQRYHGIILSDMIGASYLTIHHHDKLKNTSGPSISFYGISKEKLLEQFKQIWNNRKNNNILPIDRNIFKELTHKVENALCGNQK